MAGRTYHQAVAALRWTKATITGDGPHAAVVRSDHALEVILHANWSDAQATADNRNGRYCLLQSKPRCTEDFGYRERASA
jgi:hypothetical protein